jgi:hypothetical protein
MKQVQFYCYIWDYHSGDYEGHGLLGCNAVLFGKCPTFQRNKLLLTSGSRVSQARNEQEAVSTGRLLPAGFFLVVDPEAGSDMFLRNVRLSPSYMAWEPDSSSEVKYLF